MADKDAKPQGEEDQEKGSASERINLQHIMELREAFDLADTDHGGALEIDEFILAFGEIIGKNMTQKQLNQLFMKIDADSNGSVDWPEFMNYMLLENQTLSSMKREHFEYVRVGNPKNHIDPEKQFFYKCHASMITAILVLEPEGLKDKSGNTELLKRKIRYATSSRDGYVKIWNAYTMQHELYAKVTSGAWVTCMAHMEGSKKLACGSANRMISFYRLDSSHQGTLQIESRIEDLVAIPMCLEYYWWKDNDSTKDDKFETLLCGDGLGICHMWNFKEGWYTVSYKQGSLEPMVSQQSRDEIVDQFKKQIDQHFESMEKTKKAEKNRLRSKVAGGEEDKAGDSMSKTVAKPDSNKRMKKKIIKYEKQQKGVTHIEKVIHRSWVTKIKYYDDLKYVISSSVDSLIHIHEIDDLSYKDEKTFNIHQKPVNSFIYSQKSRFIASCGEERHILMWDPFTLGVLTYLYGHNTSVQDLALNEERYHLISLGTDKCVKIWDTRTYLPIQTIFDKLCYRPEDRLTALEFDPYTNNILLGSRKINQWFFKTQEEIKTSHEYPVAFALNNSAFESVVSADDGGFIAVWDLEDGQLMSKFGNAHVNEHDESQGFKMKVTTGCLDSTQRRLITAGEDGTVKMWNFSNGQKLTQLISKDAGFIYKNPEQIFPSKSNSKKNDKDQPEDKKKKIKGINWKSGPKVFQDFNKGAGGEKDGDNEETIRDDRVEKNEITKLVCMFDPEEADALEDDRTSKVYVIGVGWDRKVHIWQDDKDEVVETLKTLPQNKQQGHAADIMSCTCYYQEKGNQMIYTGGHDGSLISWSMDTGSAKRYLHDMHDKEWDKMYDKDDRSHPRCMALLNDTNEGIRKSKSVEALLILEKRNKLMSMTADQWLRFWSLNELDTEGPSFKFDCKHSEDDTDQLTACSITKSNQTLVTADTSGQMKIWNIKDVDFNDQTTENKFILKVFIIAHKALINTIQIVENIDYDKGDKKGDDTQNDEGNDDDRERFIITASQDGNINLHRLKTGLYIGQFGKPENPQVSTKCWDLKKMEKYEQTRRPRYVREWYLKLKNRFKKREVIKQIAAIKAEQVEADSPTKGQASRETVAPTKAVPTKPKESQVITGHGKALEALARDAGLEFKKIDGSFDEDQEQSDDEIDSQNFQEQYYEEMIDNMRFSDEEEEEDDLYKKQGFIPPVRQEKKGDKKNDVNQNAYFDFIQNKYPPDIVRYNKKWPKQGNFQQSAIRMTGKGNMFKKDKDENEEEEWPAVFGPIYDRRMEQLSAQVKRKKRQELEQKEFNWD